MKQIAAIVSFFILISLQGLFAQNSRIKCYFNYPVNTSISSGANAAYLNGSFPDTIAAYINRAKYSVDICLYNYTAVSSSKVRKIANAVNAAATRGVVVRWIYNGTDDTNNTGLVFVNSSVQKLASPNYSTYIMHNKFMVIDVNAPDSNDAVAMTGSYNWSDQQTFGDVNNIVFINSKQVALAFYNEFNKMWGSTGPAPDVVNSKFSIYKTSSAQTRFDVGGTIVEVYFSPKDALGSRLQNTIYTANYDMFFGIYAFTDMNIANLIKSKYNAGVNARGIIDEFGLSSNGYDILSPVMGSNLLLFSGNDLYHNKAMLIDALNPESDPQVFTGSFNWTFQGQSSNDENAVVIHDAAVANQYYQSFCQNFASLGGLACASVPCPGGNTVIVSSARGTNYQWQADAGNGFENISNGTVYNGTTTANLTLTNAPTSWYGYQYRCIADGNIISRVTALKFTAYWNGSTSTAWENPANWNCGVLPDANTDVVVSKGVKFFPAVNTSTSCRSIKLNNETTATLQGGVELILTGKQ